MFVSVGAYTVQEQDGSIISVVIRINQPANLLGVMLINKEDENTVTCQNACSLTVRVVASRSSYLNKDENE
jgi:hypothetical protein